MKTNHKLTRWILVGMALGLLIGAFLPTVAVQLRPLSMIFIRLIKSIIVPLVFATLVVGIAGHGNLRTVGRMGVKALIYFEIVTTLALFIGLMFVNLYRPGVGVALHGGDMAGITAKKQTFTEVLVHIVPQSFFQAAAEGEVLQVVVFSVLFAIGLSMVLESKRKTLLDFFDAVAEAMFKFTGVVMRYAPVGVGAAIAVAVGSKGLGVLKNLGLLILTYYTAILFFFGCVLLPVALFFRVPIRRFFIAMKEPAAIAFSTTSSEAALPKAMQVMENFGVPRNIVAFILPTGYSFNLDGTALYLSLASVFVAQAAGMHMSLGKQLFMVFTLMLTSKGVAGVPRASLVILAGTLASFGLPLEGIAILLGVDELMDMGRTTVNVVGNCLASAVIARWEGFDLNAAGETSEVKAAGEALEWQAETERIST